MRIKVNTPLGFSALTLLILAGALYPFFTNAPQQIGFAATLMCSLTAFALTMAAVVWAVFFKRPPGTHPNKDR